MGLKNITKIPRDPGSIPDLNKHIVDNVGGAGGNIFCAAKYVRREVT